MLVVLGLCFAVVAARLTQLQAFSADHYAAVGVSQTLRTVELPADRGAIFDRNGTELALSIPQRTVWADPRLVDHPHAAAEKLAPVLGMDVAVVEERLSKKGAFVYLARKVDDDVADRIEKLEVPGVALLNEPERFRPAGALGQSLLGTVGLDNDGLAGLELQFDDVLTGIPGSLVFERGRDGRTIAAGEHHLEAAVPGEDLVLTIDRSLQYELERSLTEAISAATAEGGMAAVMNPKTGEVLAMANLEADPETGEVHAAANNATLTNVYEPGSVNKVITLAGAIEDGLVEPDTVLQVPDHLRVSTHTYTDHDPHPVTDWTVADILTNSSNIGTIMIAQQLGKDRIDHYLRAFGFGSPTGLGFPGESGGLLLPRDGWDGTSMGSVPIGNGLAVTAVQMLAAYNTVANDGVYVQPTMVKATVDADGTEHPVAAAPQRRVISTETAQQMSAMLTEVVKSGTGTKAEIKGYTVAGKTGTARKPSQVSRGYEPGAYVSSFAGFVPAEDPELSVIVVLDEPTPIFGGIVAAPVFADVAGYGLRLFKIPPPPPAEDNPDAPVTDPPPATLEARNDVPNP